MIAPSQTPCDAGVIRGARATQGCADRAKPWVLAATILGSGMAFIDGSVVVVALPAIQSDLGTSVAAAQWVVNGYMLTLSAFILAGGAAGDRFGRRRVFVVGVAMFTIASLGCALAPGPASLVLARAIQGVGGALLVPGSLAIISAAFPEGERGRAIGTWAGVSALTTALGPVLGGWLVDVWSWRPVFFVNLPLAVLTLWITLGFVPESRDDGATAPVDWLGGALAAAGLGAIVYGLTGAAERGWTAPQVLTALVAGVLVLAVFLRREARTPGPMLPLDLFRSSAFAGANAMTLLLYFALNGVLFFLPFDLIRIQRYSAAEAGAAFLPLTLAMGGLSWWSGAVIDRFGARLPLTAGPVVVAAALVLLAYPGIGGSYWTTFFPGLTVLGVGLAISVAPLTTTVMDSVDPRHAGTASGINNAVARLAGLLAIALLGVVAVRTFGAALDRRLADLSISPDLARAVRQEVPRLAEAAVPAGASVQEHAAVAVALSESFVIAFRTVMLVAAGLAVLSGLCAALTIAPATARTYREGTETSR